MESIVQQFRMAPPKKLSSWKDFLGTDPVEHCLKCTLFLGRVIGVVPYTFRFKPTVQLSFRWFSISSLHTLFLGLIALILPVTSISFTLQRLGTYPTILEELVNLEKISFRLSAFFIYFYFLKNTQHLLQLLEKWSAAMKRLSLVSVDEQFPKFCVMLTALVLGIGATENILCDVYTAGIFDGQSTVESFIKLIGMDLEFGNVVNATVLTLLYAVGIYALKMGTYTWNFGDIFLIVVCRAISFKFSQINEQIREFEKVNGRKDGGAGETQEMGYLVKNEPCYIFYDSCGGLGKGKAPVEKIPAHENSKENLYAVSLPLIRKGFGSWEEIREKILLLCDLSRAWTSFVAPLLLACYGCNLYLIIQRIFCLLQNAKTVDDINLYSYVSAFQFTMRVFLVTYHASQVYHSTENIVSTLEQSSNAAFSDTACQLERMLDRHPVGVTLFGAFPITRKFFISIVSFIFTTEIVLLQAMSATQSQRNVGTD